MGLKIMGMVPSSFSLVISVIIGVLLILHLLTSYIFYQETHQLGSSLEITWKTCNAPGAHGQIDSLVITPPEPKLGSTFAAAGTGRLDEDLPSGGAEMASYNLQVSAGWY